MRKTLFLATLAALFSTPLYGQGVALFQDGVGGYNGTIDTEFRSGASTTPQGSNPNISVDQFDSGNQTQGAIRFENLLVSQGGPIPDGLTADKIIRVEFQFWKSSPSQENANINFNRVLRTDTTTGSPWGENSTWAGLGGDLIPNNEGILEGPDPINSDPMFGTIESAKPIFNPDGSVANVTDAFQNSPKRFTNGEVVELQPGSGPVLASEVYRTNRDSENVFEQAWDGTEADLQRAVAVATWSFDITEMARLWLADTNPAMPGTQPAAPNYGLAITNDTGDGFDFLSSDLAVVPNDIPSSFREFLTPEQFRPALIVIFDDGSAGQLDINKDGFVNINDFIDFADLVGTHLDGVVPFGAPGDFDFDRQIDLDDFKFFQANYPGGAAAIEAQLAGAAVPEPSAIGLCLLACGLGLRGLRNRK